MGGGRRQGLGENWDPVDFSLRLFLSPVVGAFAQSCQVSAHAGAGGSWGWHRAKGQRWWRLPGALHCLLQL